MCGSSSSSDRSCGSSCGYLNSGTGCGYFHCTISGLLRHKVCQEVLLVILEIEPEAGCLVAAAEPGEGEGDTVARDLGDDIPVLLIQINDQRISNPLVS